MDIISSIYQHDDINQSYFGFFDEYLKQKISHYVIQNDFKIHQKKYQNVLIQYYYKYTNIVLSGMWRFHCVAFISVSPSLVIFEAYSDSDRRKCRHIKNINILPTLNSSHPSTIVSSDQSQY